mmetsp:Transcript_33101/g.39637  ORF Transcript_33101/g.39637 Transcript_33101/m.39637 type:complete len:420 (+) Transcript_33101:40-1299(+)|eukprot:CAMPEP_0198249562 /NCGR_PEP_ID=MMETSP1447-20131203/1055_1 /TAXON_ID=420782 /ORGANISM="Chaetoceros dichaeta, Strain CCMP1751" /LENGTH=419 /DNA_ID=CAMNT_0043934233 /DNA_START=40 /DNA_END=1299 /DNA_ORIENTATION=-
MSTKSTTTDTTTSDLPFYNDLHITYIQSLRSKLDSPSSYEGAVTEHLRMSGIYWSLTALSLLCDQTQVESLMGLTSPIPNEPDGSDEANKEDAGPQETIVDWVFECYDSKTGGFGGNKGHDAHLLYTLSAVQILVLADALSDPRLDVDKICSFVSSLQLDDGSFVGSSWGEVDTRFSYCALSTLSILGRLDCSSSGGVEAGESGNTEVDVTKAAEFIIACQNFDGGFGSCPGAESHAGQIFCCVGALSIASSLHRLGDDNVELLAWWLAERQCDSGGLNGRPEKQADVCYSWWILSSLSILGKVDWINVDKLTGFILKAQDEDDGGIADRPGDMVDVFHTFFGIAGLSLVGYLHKEHGVSSVGKHRKIDPLYALPTDIVERLNLKGQILSVAKEGVIDDRLRNYDVYLSSNKTTATSNC